MNKTYIFFLASSLIFAGCNETTEDSTSEDNSSVSSTNADTSDEVEIEMDEALFGTWMLVEFPDIGMSFLNDGSFEPIGEGENPGVSYKFHTYDQGEGPTIEVNVYQEGKLVHSRYKEYSFEGDTLFLKGKESASSMIEKYVKL